MIRSPFDVEWSATALRSLDRLPAKVAVACVEFAYGGLGHDPQRVGHPLRFDLEGLHSACRGDFRMIYRIDEPRRVLTIIAIHHRSDAYRPR